MCASYLAKPGTLSPALRGELCPRGHANERTMLSLARGGARSCPALCRAAACAQPQRSRSSSATEAAAAAGLGVAPSIDEVSVTKLYRDCMKLTYHIAAQSVKGDAMRQMVRMQFRSQMHVTDTAEIKRLKMLAIKGLQNYVIHESTGRAVAKRRDGQE